MKKLKWICRYAFLSLLLVGGIGWTVYCHLTVAQLESLAGSLEFIDMAVSNPKDAVAVLERIDQFKSLRETGLMVSAAMAVCLCLLVVYHVLAPKLLAVRAGREKKQKPKKQKQQKAVSPAPVAIPTQATDGEERLAEDLPVREAPVEKRETPVRFCPECGTAHQGAAVFCSNCGTRIP